MTSNALARMIDDEFDAATLRRALGLFPSGVTAFGGLVADQPIGMAASSFTSVSLDPALVSICVAKTSTTWPAIQSRQTFGISVLSKSQGEVARRLSVRADERFAGIHWRASTSGAVFIDGAPLWLECAPYRVIPAGDHVIVVLQILGLASYPDEEPMVFHRSGFHAIQATA